MTTINDSASVHQYQFMMIDRTDGLESPMINNEHPAEQKIINQLEDELTKICTDTKGVIKDITNVDDAKKKNKPCRKRKRECLLSEQKELLDTWLQTHINNPYPSDDEKVYLAQETGLDKEQVSNWFVNARKRSKQIQDTGRVPPPQTQKKNAFAQKLEDSLKKHEVSRADTN